VTNIFEESPKPVAEPTEPNAVAAILGVAYSLLALVRSGSIGYEGDFSSQSAQDRAARENLLLVEPTRHQLQIDIDNAFAQATYNKNYPSFSRFYDVELVEEAPSKSNLPHKKHITITVSQEIEPEERLVLQAFLGSDLTREFLGLQRIKGGDPIPTLFLEKKPTPVDAPIDDIEF
jgi:hypothetical protein